MHTHFVSGFHLPILCRKRIRPFMPLLLSAMLQNYKSIVSVVQSPELLIFIPDVSWWGIFSEALASVQILPNHSLSDLTCISLQTFLSINSVLSPSSAQLENPGWFSSQEIKNGRRNVVTTTFYKKYFNFWLPFVSSHTFHTLMILMKIFMIP